eukprot:1138185-Pelagomonas_calceolata.AAC.5
MGRRLQEEAHVALHCVLIWMPTDLCKPIHWGYVHWNIYLLHCYAGAAGRSDARTGGQRITVEKTTTAATHAMMNQLRTLPTSTKGKETHRKSRESPSPVGKREADVGQVAFWQHAAPGYQG